MLQASAQAANEVECTALSRVEIVPSEISGKFDQSALINPYLGLCLDGDLMRILLSAISNDLIARGYVTTRPYLLEQDISDGQVEIRILAGKIESIVDAESGVANGKIMTAFMFSDEILNLRDLETSLEAIERPDSVSASFEIRPGTQPGGSIVAIRTEASNPLRTELGVIAQTELDTQLSFQASPG